MPSNSVQRLIDRLENHYRALSHLPATLSNFCRQPKPFAHPFYWAAFICQGMA